MQPLTNLPPFAYIKLAEEVKVPLVHLVNTITLMEEGATIPFLARYRKEVTGNMDEERLRLLQRRLDYYRELEERRKTILKAIEEQGALTAELRARIESVLDGSELEDLYLPYKPGRKTRAGLAREKGLEPLARWLRAQQPDGRAPEQAAERFVHPAGGVETVEQALAGARDIVAEWISDDPDIRKALRAMVREQAVLVARKSEKADQLLQQQKDVRSKYEEYYDFREPVSRLHPPRLLAIRRGVREGFLTSEVRLDEAGPIGYLTRKLIRDPGSLFAPQLEQAAREAWRRGLEPALQNELRAELKARADGEAIRAVQESLRALLLAPPAGPIAVLGVDPGYRNGCQVAAVDETGRFLESAVVYPHEPRYDTEGARRTLKDLILRRNIRAVAIGDGAASAETDHFIRALVRDEKLEDVFSIVISEAGAAAYSASRPGREELPDLDATVRRAVSIARRLQDPLAELVKIDPKAVAVGPPPHEVDQGRLEESLHAVVESCVNGVGVDVNTASVALLRYVAGINERVAKRIVEFRQANGPFRSREQLRQVPGFGPKTFEQAAGFLRIRGGENPLDGTAVHPESYSLVEKMAASLGVPVADLIARPDLVEQVRLEAFQSGSAGMPTLNDIRDELRRPGRDVRPEFVVPRHRNDILVISDLKEGMELEGVVSNVTSFGAFVDVGVHQDGLVHVSELSDKFIKDPHEAVKVGDVVKVRVLSADPVARRISLSMKPAPPPKVEKPVRPRPEQPVKASGEPAGKPAKDRRGERAAAAKAKPKPMSLEEKLAILQSKFRTRV